MSLKTVSLCSIPREEIPIPTCNFQVPLHFLHFVSKMYKVKKVSSSLSSFYFILIKSLKSTFACVCVSCPLTLWCTRRDSPKRFWFFLLVSGERVYVCIMASGVSISLFLLYLFYLNTFLSNQFLYFIYSIYNRLCTQSRTIFVLSKYSLRHSTLVPTWNLPTSFLEKPTKAKNFWRNFL